jgi:large subunit ribosomal protein L25
MEVTTLKGSARTALGKRQVARLRSTGMVPAVIYGGGGGPAHVEFSLRDLDRELRHHHRVFKLDVDGSIEGVYLQHVQFDQLTDEPMHIDFKRIDLEKPLEVEVELLFVGHPAGAAKGGQLVKDLHSLTVRSLPSAVPSELEVNINSLDLDTVITAAQVALPAGVSLRDEPDTVVCHMVIPVPTATAAAPSEAESVEPESVAPKKEGEDKGDED